MSAAPVLLVAYSAYVGLLDLTSSPLPAVSSSGMASVLVPLLSSAGLMAATVITMLLALKGIGANFAAVLWSEAFYRGFANRRQVAAYAGLAATPWQSGGIRHEQGVSKAGNPRLRTTMIQIAWLWIRHQPRSALTRWFRERSQQGRKRSHVERLLEHGSSELGEASRGFGIEQGSGHKDKSCARAGRLQARFFEELSAVQPR